jgi:hypothetical protein
MTIFRFNEPGTACMHTRFPLRGCSSTGESSRLLSGRLKVRSLPPPMCPPVLEMADRRDLHSRGLAVIPGPIPGGGTKALERDE